MWQCDNCGYTDEDGTTFEEQTDGEEESTRFCPECGSDEVFEVDEDEDSEDDEDFDDSDMDEEEDDDWDGGSDDDDDEWD